MKRILVLALALILAVSSLAVPSYAAETPDAIVNLLTGVEYSYFHNGLQIGTTSVPYLWLPSSTNFGYEWKITNTNKLNSVLVGIVSEVKPKLVGFSNGSFEWQIFYAGTVGNVHYFTYDITAFVSDLVHINIYFDAPYEGFVGIDSVFGFSSDSISYNSVSYFANAIMYDNGEGGSVPPSDDDFRWPVSIDSGNNVSLPVVVDYDGPTGSDFYSIDYGEIFLKVPLDQGLDRMSSISFLLYTCDEILSAGARLESSAGVVYNGIPCLVEYCGETQMLFETEENFHRLKCYIVTVDLVGYDLSGLTLTLQTNVKRAFGSFIYQYDYGFYFQCDSIYGLPLDSDVPWYSLFANWLKGQFSTLSNALTSSIGNFRDQMVTWFSQVSSDISSFSYNVMLKFDSLSSTMVTWFSQISSDISSFSFNVMLKFDDLKSSLGSWFSSVISALNSSGDNQGFNDDVQNQGDKLDDMEEVMDSVTKPALNRVDTNISGIVSDTDLANTAHVYTYIIDDNIMAPALTMVTILAMMSFALFGKR